MHGLLESTGFPQDTTSPLSEVVTQEWSFDLSSYDGWRPNFVYFNIFDQESTLDVGYGDYDITDHDIEKLYKYGLLYSHLFLVIPCRNLYTCHGILLRSNAFC